MKEKRFYRTVFCLVMVFSLINSAFAEAGNMLTYTYANTINATLSIESGTATASGKIQPIKKSKTTIEVKLQQFVGGKWSTIAAWIGSNAAGSSEISRNKKLTKGYSYRVYVIGRVYNSSGDVLETISKASSTKSY